MFEDLSNFFVQKLVELRMKKGVSAREMSLDLGLNSSYINRLENNKTFPTMENFFNICEYFNLSPKEFFKEVSYSDTRIYELISILQSMNEKQIGLMLEIAYYISNSNELEKMKSKHKE